VQGCLPASLRCLQKAEVLLHIKGKEVLGWPKKTKGEGHVAVLSWTASLRGIVTWSLYSGVSVKVQKTEQCRCDLQPHMDIGFDIFWK